MHSYGISLIRNPSSSSTLFFNKTGKRRASPMCVMNSTISTPSLTIDADTFTKVSKKCNLIPLYQCIFSDQLTPVMAYRCLVNEEDRESPSFLFDSFGQGYQASNVGRYSAVGHEPVMEILAKENHVMIIDHDEGRKSEEVVDDPLKIPEKIMKGWTPMQIHELPDFFCGK